jgi:cellulose synthase (UDP-forming)
MFHCFAFFVNVFGTYFAKPLPKAEITDWSKAPEVAILIPARHEERDVLDTTLTCMDNLDYPNKSIYLLDDSSLPEYNEIAEEMAKDHGAHLFRRAERHGAKAGIINDCIRTLNHKYIVVFDADQMPIPRFLKETIPYLEADPKLAYMQTPQFYSNIERSTVAEAANLQFCIFYGYILEGKSGLSAMMCCGTNDVIRREALQDVGGFDETSITEDFSTSLDLRMRGWKGAYFNHVQAFGTGPFQLGPFFKQQWRWSRGNIGNLGKVLRNLLLRPWKLSPAQWLEDLATGSFFLIGWAYFILLLCPLTYIFFNIPSFSMNPLVYAATFIPYCTFGLGTFYLAMAQRHYSFAQMCRCVALGFLCIPVYMYAAVAALFRIKSSFMVTAKRPAGPTPYSFLWAQAALWFVTLVGLVWGFNRMVMERNPSVGINLIWILYNFSLLSMLFYFREGVIPAESRAPHAETAS